MPRFSGPLLLCLVLLLAPAPERARAATVLLVENPGKLVVYNKYQQTATAEEQSRLRPFEPLLIVREDEKLPDGFTSCMQVRVDGEPFYLVKDGTGSLAGLHEAGAVQKIGGAEMLSDTVRASSDLAATLPGGGPQHVRRGTIMVRLFRAAGRIYVRLLRGDGGYGWVTGAESALLRPYRAVSLSPSAAPPAIETSVRTRLEETNATLRRLYTLLNKQTGRNLSPPVWSLSLVPGALVCRLSSRGGSTSSRSTRFLAKDIENSLFGSGCRVETGTGFITVFLP